MEHKNWKCPKCGNPSFETDEIRTTGGFFTKLFNIQNKRFTTVTCKQCQYTEIYRTDSSTLGNILDFFTN